MSDKWQILKSVLIIGFFVSCFVLSIHLILKILFIFRERGREEKREGEKHRCGRETLMVCLSVRLQLGTWPATQACALTRNWINDLLIFGVMPNPLSHTSHTNQGLSIGLDPAWYWYFKCCCIKVVISHWLGSLEMLISNLM